MAHSTSLFAATLYRGNHDVTTSLGISDQLRYRVYISYAGAGGMLLHIKGKFTMGKLKKICFVIKYA
jgi:hypothetical protein